MAVYFITRSYFVILFSASMVASRKYDVESEALRLFGENFATVLRRFRRSPDYLKILQEKHDEMDSSFYEVSIQTAQHIENKLLQRVNEMLGNKAMTSTPSDTTPKARRSKKNAKRQNGDQSSETENPIELLDQYDHLHQKISVQDRNKFKDMAFEMAGLLINLIIKGMGPGEPPKGSHKGNEPATDASTRILHDHEGHTTEKSEETIPDKTYKFKRTH